MDIYNSHNPTLQDLEEYKKQNVDSPQLQKVIDFKIAALKAEETALTKTMNAEQLFEAHNPLWARQYSLSELSFILAMSDSIDNKAFAEMLGQTTDYKALTQNSLKSIWEPRKETNSEYIYRLKRKIKNR